MTNRKKESNKSQEKQVLRNTVAHNQPICEQQSMAPGQHSPVYALGMILYGISLWPLQVSSPGQSPSCLLVHLLSGRVWDTEESSTLLLNNNQNMSMLSALLSCWTQNTALYKLLGRNGALSQLTQDVETITGKGSDTYLYNLVSSGEIIFKNKHKFWKRA